MDLVTVIDKWLIKPFCSLSCSLALQYLVSKTTTTHRTPITESQVKVPFLILRFIFTPIFLQCAIKFWISAGDLHVSVQKTVEIAPWNSHFDAVLGVFLTRNTNLYYS